MSRGRFITFEGGEACGKSTQLNLLADRLRQSGHTIRMLREPGGTPLGEELRNLLKHHPAGRGMAPEAELLLMNASRAELVRDVIRPAIAAGEVVLCDRFHDSSIAYQAYGRGLEIARVRAVVDFATNGTTPDLTFLFLVPRPIAIERIRRRANAPAGDRFEEEDESFFRRVESGYRDIAAAEPSRVRIIDGTAETHVVASEVARLAGAALGL